MSKAVRIQAKLIGHVKDFEHQLKDPNVKYAPDWTTRNAKACLAELKTMKDQCTVTIDTRGSTPLLATVEQADAMDKKAKGVGALLAQMLALAAQKK